MTKFCFSLYFQDMMISKAYMFSLMYFLAFILMYLDKILAATSTSEAEIIQTADEWNDAFCQIKQFNQSIEVEGCKTVYVMNSYCYGQCRSLFMPYKKQGLFTCYLCTAAKKKIKNITLQCSENDETKQKQFKLTIVQRCQCKRAKFTNMLPPK